MNLVKTKENSVLVESLDEKWAGWFDNTEAEWKYICQFCSEKCSNPECNRIIETKEIAE